MAAMSLSLLILSAAALSSPQATTPDRPTGASAIGRVSVTILEGARIAASEVQDAGLPALSDSQVRTPDGEQRAARLVEFE